MKREGYKFGVAWIALNDDPGSADSLEVESVRGYISVGLLADLFGKHSFDVATDVVAYREKQAAQALVSV